MPQGSPGYKRPRRFSLRRARRYPSPSYRSGRSAGSRYADPGSTVARRSMLGAAALVAAAGVADLIRVLGRSTPSRAAGSSRLVKDVVGTPTSAGEPAVKPSLAPSLTPSHVASSAPTVSHHHEHVHGNTAPHSHHHTHPHSHDHDKHGHHHPAHSHGRHHANDHHHHDGHAKSNAHKKAEHVTLPPTKLRVREHPAYQLDQLIKDPPKKALALTIDDGPDPAYTPHVLRLLDKFGMQASFCIIGEHAAVYPSLVRDIARAGHVIVNHSYTHVLPFNTLTEKRIVWEITKTQRTIEKAAGVTPQLFRSPGGDWSHFIYRAIAAYGLEPLDWDVDPRDWALPGTKAIERRMLRARPGEIVLCHDGGGNRSETVRALRKVLPTWKRRGYVTVPLLVDPHFLAEDPDHTSTPTP